MKTRIYSYAWIFVCLLCQPAVCVKAQSLPKDFKSESINRQVKDYPDRFELGTPLDAYITNLYLHMNGKYTLWRDVISYRLKGFIPKKDVPAMTGKERKQRLGATIKEIVTYKDSVVAVISKYESGPHITRYLVREDGRWMNAEEEMGRGLQDTYQNIIWRAPFLLECIHRINELKIVPANFTPFVDYLKREGREPKEFLLDAVTKHKIVVYGEIHRRMVSWNLLMELIKEPDFQKKVGTVFMEISSDKQPELDHFFASETLNPEIILDVFRDMQLFGWKDRGMYEFLLTLWQLNHSLPAVEQIKVIAVDIPRPFGSLKTRDEYTEHFNQTPDRNEQMATVIENTVKSATDSRNSLFIVGMGHAYKSLVPGVASGKAGHEPLPTAVVQLSKLFAGEEVYCIFSHGPNMDNTEVMHGKLRHGIFDQAFSQMENKPVAFALKGSPFGKEPFDGLYEITYDKRAGNYEDNYDAYLFLVSPEEERGVCPLPEIYSKKFVKELNRRGKMVGDEYYAKIKRKKLLRPEMDCDKKRWNQEALEQEK